jgi:hypothetical protein
LKSDRSREALRAQELILTDFDAEGAKLSDQSLARIIAATRHHQASSFARERECGGAPNSSERAGDYDY